MTLVARTGCIIGIDSYTMGLVVIAIGTSIPVSEIALYYIIFAGPNLASHILSNCCLLQRDICQYIRLEKFVKCPNVIFNRIAITKILSFSTLGE